MVRCAWLMLFVIPLIAAVCPAGSIAAEAEVSAPADRVAVMLFIRREVTETDSGAAAMDATWDRARQWLINNGFKPDQILVSPVLSQLFGDEKQYLMRRITLVEPIDPDKADATAERLARLVDQAMARGLEPASRLAVLAGDQRGMLYRQGQTAGQFIFFLPSHPSELVEQAALKAMEQLRQQAAMLAAATQLPAAHLLNLTIREPALLESDLAEGRMGVSGASADEVLAQVKITAEFPPESAAARTLETVGQGRIETDIEQAVLYTRLAAVNSSFQGALDDLAEQKRRLEEAIKPPAKSQLMLEGIAFFSGFANGINIGGNMAAGQVPGGAYREARFRMVREKDEGLADFRIRVENAIRAMRGGRIDRPYQPPAVLALWGVADENPWVQKAMAAAVRDARDRAARHADALGMTLGAILGVNPAPEQDQSPMAILLNQFLMDNPHPLQRESAGIMVRFGEKPILNVPLSVRFAVQMDDSPSSNQYNPTR